MAIFDFLSLYCEYVVAGIFFILAVVSFLVTLFTKRDVTKSIKSFEEVLNLPKKYLTAETRKIVQQEFSEEVPDYVLSARTNELQVSSISKNIQDYINSHIDTALERALQRFTVPNVIDEDVVEDYTKKTDDLSSMAEAMEIAEYYRDAFNLPVTASISDIYAAVDKKASELKLKIKEVDDVKKKEVEPKN